MDPKETDFEVQILFVYLGDEWTLLMGKVDCFNREVKSWKGTHLPYSCLTSSRRFIPLSAFQSGESLGRILRAPLGQLTASDSVDLGHRKGDGC